MILSELIEELQRYPHQDLEVVITWEGQIIPLKSDNIDIERVGIETYLIIDADNTYMEDVVWKLKN